MHYKCMTQLRES